MKTVLIAEDNHDMLENIVEILELAGGYRVVVAGKSSDVVSLAHETKPNVILCDIVMPGMNGYEVLRELKRDARTAAIPFIFISATVDRKGIQTAINMGADAYIQKPFELAELLRTIRRVAR